MRGGSWCFTAQYNRITEQNTIKGRQPYPRNINLAGLWSTWGLLYETSWPREGRGFQLHLLTLSRTAPSIDLPSYSHLAGSPASWHSLRYPWNCLSISTQESWVLPKMPHESSPVLPGHFGFFHHDFHAVPSPFQAFHVPTCSSAAVVQGSSDSWYSPSLCALMVPWLTPLFGLTTCQPDSEDG